MAQLFNFDEDVVLNSTHADSIVTNRSASGPITVFLPDDAAAGFTVEVHMVEPYPVMVAGQSSGDNLLGQGSSTQLAQQGQGIRLIYTAPHFWSGMGA